MDDIIREAQEEARLEAIQNFLKKHGKWVIMGLIAILALSGGYSYWRSQQAFKAEKTPESFISTLENLQSMDSKTQQKKLADIFHTNGYGDLAKLVSAQLLANASRELDEATLQKIATFVNDKKMDKNLHQFMIIALSHSFLGREMKIDVLRPKIDEIIKTNGFFRGFALEALAFSHLQNKNYPEAHALFAQLEKDGLVSEITRSRAGTFRRQLECEDKC